MSKKETNNLSDSSFFNRKKEELAEKVKQFESDANTENKEQELAWNLTVWRR